MKEETVQLIPGPVGKLELAFSAPVEKENKAWAIVCHPHSMYGGTMYNKVVTTLVKTFLGLGIGTVRFNFRGVGGSEGQYDQGNGELDDLLAVINWVQQERQFRELWLAGFSFGSFVAAKAAAQIPISKLITIAPPVEHFPMQSLPPIECPWILAQGERDEVVPPEKVFAWAEHRKPKPFILRFPEADHFFHGQLNELRTRLEEALTVT
ncbi:MAG: alpha/beta fold hydrolase [Gammaproteobacteria bacterium]|nr:alpha/beta fold hydrolase [Gammaproteobacteria bacterium]